MKCYLVTAGDEIYDGVRAMLDAAWNHPNQETLTTTCLPASGDATRDSGGRIVIAVEDRWAGYEPAASMLPQLEAAGHISEITLAEYTSAIVKGIDQ
jgi:hypothetical protein